MPITTILFDLDDTLLETHAAHLAAVQVACRHASEAHPEQSPEELVKAFNVAYRALEGHLEAGSLQFSSQMLFRTRAWEEALRSCGLDPVLGEELARLYQEERRRRYALFEDVPSGLGRLAAKYRLGLVTNGLADIQREKIDAVGLGRWIPYVSISGEVGSWKPDSGIFCHALGLAAAAPSETVMVGDSLQRDVAGARGLGIRSIWLRRYEHLVEDPAVTPDATAADLHQALDLLVTWDA